MPATVFICAAVLSITGCTPAANDQSSVVKVKLPTGENTNDAKLSTMSYDFTRACYAVSVTATDLPLLKQKPCDIPSAIFSGFAVPGGDLAIAVPYGKARQLDVLVYMRKTAGEACPTGLANVASLDAAKIARVGQVISFDTTEREVALTVLVQAPASGVNLVSQYQIPNVCASKDTPPTAGGNHVVMGRGTVAGGPFKIIGVLNAQAQETSLSGGNFKMKMSRRDQ